MEKKRDASGDWKNVMRAEMEALTHVEVERLAFLLKWAAFRRRASVSQVERRAKFRRGNPRGSTLVGVCWCCGGWTEVFTHHIVQLQYGGTNHHRNLVRVCGVCHQRIHPWLARKV